MEKMLAGKVALITGGSRGLGKQIALKFASEGADIAFTDRNYSQAALEEIAALGTKVIQYEIDAKDFEAVQKNVEDVFADFGRIDILVNNAGITDDALIMRMSEDQWDGVIDVNLKSVFNYTRAVVPIMLRQRGGSIISMSSVSGIGGNAGQCNYAATKAGMIGLMKSVAKEVGSRGIRANCIAPGYIISDMTSKMPDAVKEKWVQDTLLKRGGTPDEVAKVALFLASDLSSYITGQVLSVCGGMNCCK